MSRALRVHHWLLVVTIGCHLVGDNSEFEVLGVFRGVLPL